MRGWEKRRGQMGVRRCSSQLSQLEGCESLVEGGSASLLRVYSQGKRRRRWREELRSGRTERGGGGEEERRSSVEVLDSFPHTSLAAAGRCEPAK
jgi:hypothetical protein